MSNRFVLLLIFNLAGAAMLWPAAVSHDALVSALETKYQVSKNGSNAAVYLIQKQGLVAFPPGTLLPPDCKIVDGNIEPPRLFGQMTASAVPLMAGTRVYVSKIDAKNETVKVHISTMERYPALMAGITVQKRLNAVLAFKFQKEYLSGATPDQVAGQIAAVLSPDNGAPPSAPVTDAGSAPPPPAAESSFAPVAPPPPPADNAAPPASIKIGQTPDQVTAILGQPQKINDLPGRKKVFVYSDLKVIFTNGKVTDVQ